MEPAARSQFRRAKKRPRSTTAAQQIDVPPPPLGLGIEAAAGSPPARSSSEVRLAKKRRRGTTAAAAAQIVLRPFGIEAAAAGSASRRAKPPPRRTRRTVQIPAFGIEAAAVVSASHIPRRRRTAQITIPSRRAKTVRPPHPVTNPVVSPVRRAHSSFPDLDSNKRASNSDDPLQLRPCHNYWRDLGDPQDLDDDDDGSDKLLQPLPPHRRGEDLDDDSDKKLQQLPKRVRTDLPWRDWSALGDGPAGLIAERVLAYDIADYVRFRAVCRPWRQSSTEPRTHSGLDRRFHPWRWTMLREELASPTGRCFLNTSTAECVQVDIPELHDHELLALTPEGLLVLARKPPCATTLCLLNPLTRHLTELPPLTTLLPPKDHDKLLKNNIYFDGEFKAWGSGIANDDSTFVVCFNRLGIIGMAKPGDDSWNLLKYRHDGMPTAPLMFAGRFYCVNLSGVMVLEMGADQPPQLKVAAKLSKHVSPMADSMHLVNNCGELILVHRWSGRLTTRNKSGRFYTAYQVDLDTRTLFRVKSLGGGAVFMGLYCSLSVPSEVFPSGSISADTIYPSFDLRERTMLKAGAYHLAGGSVELPCSLVARPHTLVDCLSLSNTE